MDLLTNFSFDAVWLEANILNNEFLWAAVTGGLLVMARNLPSLIWGRIVRLCSFSISAHSEDTGSFLALQVWLFQNNIHKWTNRFLLKQTYRYREKDTEALDNVIYLGDDYSWVLSLDDGTHLGFWKRIPIVVNKETEESSMFEQRHEKLTIKFIWPFKGLLQSLILPEVQQYSYQSSKFLTIHNYSSYRQNVIVRDFINPETLIYPNQLFETIIADLQRFYNDKEEYHRLGVHYHRGYGFFGPPGTGKTSMILAIASHFQIPVHKFGLRSMTISILLNHLTNIQSGIVVLEDIDVVSSTGQRKVKTDEIKPVTASDDDKDSISLDELLSVLDGLDTPEDLVFIMTSNYPEVLDSALLRPGRVDIQVKFGPLGVPETERVIRKFYPDAPLLGGEIKIIPADLQNICRNSMTLEATLETLLQLHPSLEVVEAGGMAIVNPRTVRKVTVE